MTSRGPADVVLVCVEGQDPDAASRCVAVEQEDDDGGAFAAGLQPRLLVRRGTLHLKRPGTMWNSCVLRVRLGCLINH